MKNLDEFKKDVYERAEAAEKLRAQKIKTYTRIGSVAAAFAVVIISVFAVFGAGFNRAYKASEEMATNYLSDVYVVLNDKGEAQLFFYLDRNGQMSAVNESLYSLNKEIDTKGTFNANTSAAAGQADSADGRYRIVDGDGNVRYVNAISEEKFEELLKNTKASSGTDSATPVESSCSTTSAACSEIAVGTEILSTTTAATVKTTAAATDEKHIEPETTTTRATSAGEESQSTTARFTTVAPAGESVDIVPSIIKTVYEYSDQKRYASYFAAHTTDEFLRWAKSNGIDVPENEVTNKYVYSKCFSEFVAFVIPNGESYESVEVTSLTFDDGTLTLNYKLSGGTVCFSRYNAFLIFVYLPEGTTDITIENDAG